MEAQWTLYTGAEDFRGREDIIRVRMAPNVTDVGEEAFGSCPDLQEVDLGNVTKIGECAFLNCRSLVNLRLPPTVIEIGDEAFFDCLGLERVDLGNVTKIGCCSFRNCRSLVNLRLPPTVIEIGDKAFCSCVGLERVDLSNVSKIGRYAFARCAALEILTVPPTLMAIGEGAFMCCGMLRAVLFGQGVHHVGEGAFNECTSLGGIEIPPNAFVVEWGDEPSCALAEDTLIPSADGGVERTVVSGNFGQTKHFLAKVEDKINQILGQQAPTQEEKLWLIRNMIVNFKIFDATTCIELALLKATMDNERNLTTAPVTRKRRRETRENSRVVCGAEIIIPNVLLFLDGS